MAYRCLADFLEELGHAGELARVAVEVDPDLEIAEIARKSATNGGAALLFGATKGYDMPLVANLLASDERICRVVGARSLRGIAERIAVVADPAEPEGWFDKLKTSPGAAALGSLPPRGVRSGPCQQVVQLGGDVDLGALPVVRSAPREAGPTITAGVLLSADPDSHRPIAGRYDLQVLGADRLAACWADVDEPARLAAEYGRHGEKMPVAVVLGGDPAILLAAAAPVPAAADRWALAGLLREKALDVVTGRTVDLQVPAEAEIILEGYIDPAEPLVQAGPTCGPAGHYTLPRPVPVIHLTAMTHRANPIFPALLPGVTLLPGAPPHEACVIDRALSRIFLPLVKLAMPELVDYDLPTFGAGRHWATLSIRKTHAGQARSVAHAARGMRQFMFAKFLVIVDEEVDVHDPRQVLSAIATNVNPGRDAFTEQGPPDPLDVSGLLDGLAHGMTIDATVKLPGEHAGAWPEPATMSERISQLVNDRWEEYGLGPKLD